MNRAAAREMLSTYLERPVTGVLAKMGVSPNMVTFAGLLGAGVSAWLISEGMLWAGGVVMLLAGVLDLFDGSLARSTGKES
ncbi:MAG: CDP-alcohol phosphatidyltransferase family protein, partial [Chloroflexi bacterium]|nr:CDP-alcohol phosphatidyltransferase family protein [Chloroflexota bacterium]